MLLPKEIGDLVVLQAIVNAVPSPIFVKDREHRFLLMNRAGAAFIGRPQEEIIGKSDLDLFPPEQVREFWQMDDRLFATGESNENEERLTDQTGVTRTIVTRKSPVALPDGSVVLVAVLTDVTAFRAAEAHREHLAFRDQLTGLANRALLAKNAEAALAEQWTASALCGLLLIELDRFRDVNDAFGYAIGDDLLKDFAARLAARTGAAQTVARVGGDEFAILLPGLDDPKEGERLCAAVLEEAARSFHTAGTTIDVSASIGFATAKGPGCSFGELLRQADVALRRSKQLGRNRYSLFSSDMDESRRRHRELEAELAQAIATGRDLELHFQPLVSNATAEARGVEALIRWRHPRLGFIPPSHFIPLAEKSGLIVPLGDWVLEQALRTAANWQDLTIAVNVSPIQLRSPGFSDRLQAMVAKAKIDPARLEVEITETAIFHASKAVIELLRQLRRTGIRIALDDFGTGYSSLQHLRNLEIDKIKIDRSFTRQVGQATESNVIVQAVASIGKTLGLDVTAEGVETAEQREFLSTTGCTELQGYFFSPPLNERGILQLLRPEHCRLSQAAGAASAA